MIENEIMNEALCGLLIDGNDINREGIFNRLNRLNMIHHLLLCRGKEAEKELGKDSYGKLMANLENVIDTAESFHSFLLENRIALDEVMSNTSAMVFGRVSDVVSMYEEYITKEDPLKDTLIQLVPFFLSAFSEKSYISSAEIGQKGVLRDHALHIYSDIYSYLKQTRTLAGNEEARETANMMEELYNALDSAIREKQGLYLFAALYLTMYNLRAGEVLNILNQQPNKMRTEV